MKLLTNLLIIGSLLGLSSCNALNPALFTAAEEVMTNNQFELLIDRDAFSGDREVHVTVDITKSPSAK